jgi:hypothetical protein
MRISHFHSRIQEIIWYGEIEPRELRWKGRDTRETWRIVGGEEMLLGAD